MIVDNSGNLVEETIDPTAKRSFVIGNSQKIISILRDKLYSDPIKTIVQEISSNAKDANAEAGKSHLPIKIRLPDFVDNTFSIQDNGIGISPERMFNVFIQYGNSTKDTSNEAIGGLGIGAKSPFSYADNFQIETITAENGKHMKRSYHAYLGGNDEGTLIELFATETDEETGTKISLAIQQKDFRHLKDECKNQFIWWSVPPVFLGDALVIQPRKITHRINSICHIEENFSSKNSKFILLINEIAYDIETHRFTNNFFGLNDTLVITATYDDVVLTANRDSLDYREKTMKFIQKVLNESAKEFYDWFNLQINNEPDYASACKKAEQLVGMFVYSSHSVYDNANFKYKGFRLLDCYEIPWELKKYYRSKVRKLYIDIDSKKSEYIAVDRVRPSDWMKKTIIIDDDDSGNIYKTKKILYLAYGGKVFSELNFADESKSTLVISKTVNKVVEEKVNYGGWRVRYKNKVTDELIPFQVYEDLKNDYGLDHLWNVVYLSSVDNKLLKNFNFFTGTTKKSSSDYVLVIRHNQTYKEAVRKLSFSSLDNLTSYNGKDNTKPYVYVREKDGVKGIFDVGGGKEMFYEDLWRIIGNLDVNIIIVRKKTLMLPFSYKKLNTFLDEQYSVCKEAKPALSYEMAKLKFSLKKLEFYLGTRHPFYKFAKYITEYEGTTKDSARFEKRIFLEKYWLRIPFNNEDNYPEKYFNYILKMYGCLGEEKKRDYYFLNKIMQNLQKNGLLIELRNAYKLLPLP